MGDILRGLGDPAEPGCTARPYPGEPTDDAERIPRLVAVAAVVVMFVVGLTNFAVGQVGLGVAAVSIGLLVFGAALSWLAMERRRIRQAEREWLIDQPVG